MSEKTIQQIDDKVKEVLIDAYKVAKNLITTNKQLHEKIAKDLLNKEEINEKEFNAYFE
jgi:cell division protease FtsH